MVSKIFSPCSRWEERLGVDSSPLSLPLLQHLVNPTRYEQQRFQPFPPLPQPSKAGGKVSLTDRWAYLKHVLLTYRLSTVEQLSRIKPDRNMSTEHVMILIDLLIQLIKCLGRSEREVQRISTHNYLREFKLLMRQMFWIGRYDPSVMEESMLELKHHIYARDRVDEIDRLNFDRQIHELTLERDQLKQQVTTTTKTRRTRSFGFSFAVRRVENDVSGNRRRMFETSGDERRRLGGINEETRRIRRGTSETDRAESNRRAKRFDRAARFSPVGTFVVFFSSKKWTENI